MKVVLPVLAAFVAGGALGAWITCSRCANLAARDHLGDELRIHLRAYHAVDDNPQLEEYLKSRIYFLACLLEDRDLEGYEFDFGPVDEEALDGISGIKGPDSQEDIYAGAKAAHRRVNHAE